jgi:hypothetical protein
MECSFENWQNSAMGDLDIVSDAFQESSMDAYMTDVHYNNLEHVSRNERYYLPLRSLWFQKSSQANQILSSSSSTETSDIHEPKNGFSKTVERLVLQMEQFTVTIHEYGNLTHRLVSKIDEFSRCIGQMELRLDRMMHQLDSMDERVVSLDTRFKALDGYLLEVIKREKDIMQEFRDLNYSGNRL